MLTDGVERHEVRSRVTNKIEKMKFKLKRERNRILENRTNSIRQARSVPLRGVKAAKYMTLFEQVASPAV